MQTRSPPTDYADLWLVHRPAQSNILGTRAVTLLLLIYFSKQQHKYDAFRARRCLLASDQFKHHRSTRGTRTGREAAVLSRGRGYV